MAFRDMNSFVNILDTRISFSEIGSGEAYLALHGNPGSRKDFSGMSEKFNKENCRLIIPDRPGHNCSEELLSSVSDPYIDAKAYAQFIDNQCGGKSWLIGYSFGAFVACKIAAEFPEKVKGIIMYSPYIKPKDESVSSLPKHSKNPFLGTILGIFKPLLAQEPSKKRIVDSFYPVVPEESYFSTWLPRYTRFETLLAEVNDCNWMALTYKSVFEKLKNLDIPVKALFGDSDKFLDIEFQKNALAECLPKAQIFMADNAGHALPINNPEKCFELLD